MDHGDLSTQCEAFRRSLGGARHAPLDEDFVRRFNGFVAENPHVLEWQDEQGRTLLTALHRYLVRAITRKFPLATIQDLVIHVPRVLAEKDGNGVTLLHNVFAYNPTALDVVAFFAQQNPDAAKTVNAWKQTPLHCACGERAPLPVIRVLVDAYPRGMQICDKNGDAPLHYACHYCAPLDVIQLLSMEKPQVCLHRNEEGHLPLDEAELLHGGDQDVVEFMAAATTAAARVLMKRLRFNGPILGEIFEQVVANLHSRPVEVSAVVLVLSAGEMAVLFRRDDVRAQFREQI